MRISNPKKMAQAAAALLLFAGPAWAQWSTDPAVNFAVGDSASDQNLAKLAPNASGDTWVSWLDGGGSGYDVRLQRLDAQGVEGFAHNGLLISNRSFSSTQDYGLDTAANGDALLAYRDDHLGPIEVGVSRVTPAGAMVWGATGIVLTSGSGFIGFIKIAGTQDGGAVVAWSDNNTVLLQKLDSLGAPVWALPVALTPAVGSYAVADLHAAGNDVIVSMVQQNGFPSAKLLYAQKFDSTGAPQWGAAPLAIFNGGSLQFGNYPAFTMDAAGGAVFSWYSTSPSLQCWAQRVTAAGVEVWAHNGVAVATTAGHIRVDPHVSYDASTDSVLVAWKEQNTLQSMSGISAQRLDPMGNRMWGTAGATLKPLGGPDHNMARILPGGTPGGALVVWDEAPSFGNDRLYGAHLDSAGSIDVSQFDVSSTPSGKMRMGVATNAAGLAVLAWSDARIDGDIYAQALGFDGTLGGSSPIVAFCDPGSPNSTGLPTLMTGYLGSGVGSGLHLDVSQGVPTQIGYFLVGNMVTPPFPVSNGNLCLVGVPGANLYRYNVGGTNMLSVGIFDASGDLANAVSTSTTGFGFDVPTMIPGAVPFAILSGDTWNFQCWHRDTPAGVGVSNFSNGLSVTF